MGKYSTHFIAIIAVSPSILRMEIRRFFGWMYAWGTESQANEKRQGETALPLGHQANIPFASHIAIPS